MLTSTSTGENLSAVEAAAIGGFFGVFSIFMVIFYILLVIAGWKILKKAGEPGWKILIPIYNIYMLFKIVGMKNWFWGLIGVSFITSLIASLGSGYNYETNSISTLAAVMTALNSAFVIVVNVLYCIRTSKAFHHGAGFAIGLFFLQNIFLLILGFGKSKYDKKILKK
ncbi:hypothetical protein IJJ37_03460 [Candidatus Saccharibacteria bacterium]|nr:hypothetical protein [Candidatus Saccharibacteria bacterium]